MVINDILDYSKIESGKMDLEQRPFRLDDMVESAIKLVEGQAKNKNLDLSVHFTEGTPHEVVGDTIRLRQILINLLNNAVKFTSQGSVHISISACRLAGHRCEFLFSVRDTGVGIPRDKIDRLFQSFSQADASTTRRFGGTGLGLVISLRLAELMGGTLGVESEEGQGSTFHLRVCLGLADEKNAKPKTGAPLSESAGRHVLILDDNPVNRRILVEQVRAWGLVALEAETPDAALARAQQEPTPDVILTDMEMPDADGIAFGQALKASPRGANIPLVLLSSSDVSLTTEAVIRAERETGRLFAARLTKPAAASELYDALASILFSTPGREAPGDVPDTQDDTFFSELRVLVAEDNPVNRKVVGLMLRRIGCRFSFAENGEQAVATALREPFDVVPFLHLALSR